MIQLKPTTTTTFSLSLFFSVTYPVFHFLFSSVTYPVFHFLVFSLTYPVFHSKNRIQSSSTSFPRDSRPVFSNSNPINNGGTLLHCSAHLTQRMPKGNDCTNDSQDFGMCKRLVNLIFNSFTGHGRYKRLPLNSGSDATNSPKSSGAPGQEVVIDFRHIDDVPENAHSQHSGGTHFGGAVRRSQATIDGINRQKSWQEIKVKPGGIQGNGPRLTVKVEEGGRGMRGGVKARNVMEKSIANGRVGKGDHQSEETKLKSDDELRKLPSIIDQKAEEFLRSRKEAMIRNYSPNRITHF